MILRKDCKCPCHRAGHAIIHVMPCCGRNGPGSASMPRKPFRKSKKEKSSPSSPIKKPVSGRCKGGPGCGSLHCTSCWEVYSPHMACGLRLGNEWKIQMSIDNRKYDVAISFLSKDSHTAAALNDKLSEGLNVFFFPRKQEDLAGTDGLESMREPFYDTSRVKRRVV